MPLSPSIECRVSATARPVFYTCRLSSVSPCLFLLRAVVRRFQICGFRIHVDSSPPPARHASLASPRARFADPPIVEAQMPHAGFSYLFPSQPVVSSVVAKRAITPDSRQVELGNCFHELSNSSAVILQCVMRSQPPLRLMAPSPTLRPDYESSR